MTNPAPSPDDLALLERFSRLTALAIGNALLVKELRILGDKYRKLMGSATDLILLVGYDGTIVECGRAVFRIFGFAADEIIGKELFSFTTPARRDIARRNFYRILQGEKVDFGELPYLKKNGEVVYLEAEATVVDFREDPCMLVIGHDVTDRRRMQEKITIQNRELLEKNRKLMELDSLKSEFLGRISHESSNPLSGSIFGLTTGKSCVSMNRNGAAGLTWHTELKILDFSGGGGSASICPHRCRSMCRPWAGSPTAFFIRMKRHGIFSWRYFFIESKEGIL